MANGPQGGVAGAHEAQPVAGGTPRGVATVQTPSVGDGCVEPEKTAGIGGSHRGAH